MAVALTTWPTARSDASETLWSDMASMWFRSGIHKNAPGFNDFNPSTDSLGLNVKIDTGIGIIDGFTFKTTSITTIALSAADATSPRYDRIILRLDHTSPVTASLVVLTGTPASNPTLPTLTDTSTITDSLLCSVLVNAGIGTIVPSNIIDERVYTGPRGIGTVQPGTINSLGAVQGHTGIPMDAGSIPGFNPALLANSSIPAGFMMSGFGPEVPGWKFTNGQLASRSEGLKLFQLIGTAYGEGDGFSTFGLPNMQASPASWFDVTFSLGLDSSGNGYMELPSFDYARVISVTPRGPYPPVDGYTGVWQIPRFGIQGHGTSTIVTAEGGVSGTHPSFRIAYSDGPLNNFIKFH